MKFHRVALALCAALLAVAGVRAENEPSPLDLQQRRAQIRELLLKETPVGMESKEVLASILKRLGGDEAKLPKIEDHPALGPEAEKAKQRGVKSIRLVLGDYYDHPEIIFFAAPMLSRREVTAQWAFDEQDRLVDIFVDKTSSIY